MKGRTQRRFCPVTGSAIIAELAKAAADTAAIQSSSLPPDLQCVGWMHKNPRSEWIVSLKPDLVLSGKHSRLCVFYLPGKDANGRDARVSRNTATRFKTVRARESCGRFTCRRTACLSAAGRCVVVEKREQDERRLCRVPKIASSLVPITCLIVITFEFAAK